MTRLTGQADKVNLLKGVPLFEGLSKKELGALARRADETIVRAGTDLCRQGELGQEFMILLDGTASVRKNNRKVAELGPGDMLGEISLITVHPRNATVQAISDVDVLVMHRRDFSSVMDEFPSLSNKVLKTVAARLSEDL